LNIVSGSGDAVTQLPPWTPGRREGRGAEGHGDAVPGLEHARDILFGLRFGLDLYANVRPMKCLHDRLVPLKGRTAKDVNTVVFRENTEGIYVGMGGQFKKGTPDEVAINEDLNTRKGVERLIRAGFAYAKKNGKKTVHMADKSNAMKHAHELWHRCFFEVAKDYPGIDAKHLKGQLDEASWNKLFVDVTPEDLAAKAKPLPIAPYFNDILEAYERQVLN
jgi:isocitrate/isopropylmalate dehydrogenase